MRNDSLDLKIQNMKLEKSCFLPTDGFQNFIKFH